MAATTVAQPVEFLRTLPGDDMRQIMWRFTDRFDLQMLVQSARRVARGPVARMVAEGGRNSHEWTKQKAELLHLFDEAGLSAVFMDPEQGGFIEGPKNLALALLAFELSWVDGGAATCSMAGNLALAPIHGRGTPEQRDTYMRRACPPKPGEDRQIGRGAFALTEPLPYVGVETGLLSGKVRIAAWEKGKDPILQVDKRGRFITNMGFANFVTAAVDSADDRIKGSCMVILEETDAGIFDRGVPTRKLVHQLSSTRDPVFNLRVPANRIIGGYKIKDGTIVPNFSHGEIIEAVFRRTRVTVGLMTAAKLLSAVEPVIRYQRGRFRGGDAAAPGSPRYEFGLQMKEDALHRLVDVWATGEAAASLGFAAARLFDELDPLEIKKEEIFAARKIEKGRAQFRAIMELEKDALEYLRLSNLSEDRRAITRYDVLNADSLLQFAVLDSLANVLCPAVKLWNTGHGANMMREAVSLMGGYGITEDCPGFLAQFRNWINDMREIAAQRPGTGACTLATAMQLWLWSLEHLQKATDADGRDLYHGNRQGVTFPLADALCWLLAARYMILDVLELEAKGAENPVVAEGLPGRLNFMTDLCHVQSTRAAGEVGRICAELVFGYNRHPAWNDAACAACYAADDLDALEGFIPGIASGARGFSDVTEPGQKHPTKAGPCVQFDGYETFARLRVKLDGCLTGSRLAKDRAAEALTKVMIPEALDYPA